jgi:TonB-dependent siderophore receptor
MLMIRLWFVLFVCVFVSLGSLQAQEAGTGGEEQETEDEQEPPLRRFEVTVEETLSQEPREADVATKLPVPLLQVPASVSVVPSLLFESQRATLLSDALVNVPGVNIQSNFGVHDLFYVRGFDSLSSGLILFDGAPEPEATYYDLYNVDRIEVLRGPAAFLYGGGPLSGAVNLARKKPQPYRFFEASGSFGSFETFRGQMDANLSSKDSPVAFRLNLMGQRSYGYRDGRESDQIAVNPSLLWKVGERSELRVDFEFVTNGYDPDAGLPLVENQLPDVPRTRSYSSPFDFSDQEVYRFRVGWETQVNSTVTFRDRFFFSDLDWSTNGTLLVGVFPDFSGGQQVGRVLNLLENQQTYFGNQLEAVWAFKTGPVRHDFLTGFEVSRLSDSFSLNVAALPTIDLNQPVETAREPLYFLPDQSQAGRSRNWVLAPYLLDRLQFGEKFHLFLGGRWDYQDFDDEENDFQATQTKFNPLLGFLVAPDPTLSLYVSGGTAFSPPSTLVTDDRRPEESQQVEFGVKKLFMEGKFAANVSVYYLTKDNIAIPDATGVTRRLGDHRSRGVEVGTSMHLGSLWNCFFNYSFNDSELTRFAEITLVNPYPPEYGIVDRSGNRAPFAPRHILNLWSAKDFPNGFGVGGGFRVVSDQFIAPDNAFSIDSYATLDAMVSYRFEKLKFSLNLKNITDSEYETRGFGTSAVIPADGFGIFGTIQIAM